MFSGFPNAPSGVQFLFYSISKSIIKKRGRLAHPFSVYSIAFPILPRARSVGNGNINTNCVRPNEFRDQRSWKKDER